MKKCGIELDPDQGPPFLIPTEWRAIVSEVSCKWHKAEHQRLVDSETAESLAAGFGRWQARVEFPSHREAVALARKLEGEGWTVVRRWKFLIVGADNEDDVREIAGQIRREAPPDAVVRIEEPGVGGVFIPS